RLVIRTNTPPDFWALAHPLSVFWGYFWRETPLAFLASVPGIVAACAIILPVVCWMSYRLYQLPERNKLILPYLLRLAAAATFMPRTANDYNLFFLPLAILVVWDKRDSVVVHILMGFLLLWWQP